MPKPPKLYEAPATQKNLVTSSITSRPSIWSIPLGLPDQINNYPTAPIDRGDETQDRFRYQWAIGAVLLAEGISGSAPSCAIWCEHHEDFLVELSTGRFRAIQVKTDGGENAKWKITDDAFVKSVQRFCSLEKNYGLQIEQYEFCSNAPCYVPGYSATEASSVSGSPARLIAACITASTFEGIADPYKGAFNKLATTVQVDEMVLFSVIRKLVFRQGPPLRGYLDTLVARVIPELPGCAELTNQRLRKITDELMRLVETASGIPTGGIDGVLAYIASNGRPEISLRGKCITIDAAKTSIAQAKQLSFRYVGCGEGLPLGRVTGQKNVLHKKMQSAFLEGQFEPMWLRVISTEKRLLEQALSDPEGFESFAHQLEGAVLTECKDIAAVAALEVDDRKRGQAIYSNVLQKLADMAVNDPAKVGGEPKDTLLGVAGMLSGSCRFDWGVPLEGKDNGT